MLKSSASGAASPNLKPSDGAAPPVNPGPPRPEPQALLAQLGRAASAAGLSLEQLSDFHEAFREHSDLVKGVAAYRRHPWVRQLPEPPVIWAEGETRLLEFVPQDQAASGPVILFVPSLINRAYVLDLAPGHSMLRWLAGEGFRCMLLDWGWPGFAERQFTITNYVAGRLERALAFAYAHAGEKLVLAGYCMGGTLSVAAAVRRPEPLRAIVLLATPWDFDAVDAGRALQVINRLPLFDEVLAATQTMPIDLLQILFALVDPYGVGAKYQAFASLDPESERARLFVAIEDWLNDGVPLAAAVFRECVKRWYEENLPARREWQVGGVVIDPARIALPAFVAAPGRDRLVPPASARALAAQLPGAVLHEPLAGHIGMVAGANAEQTLWVPLRDWLRALPRA
ncbi:MAG: alpha/beta fold hydrolase [Acetobacteraceae bacterium]|nr:alpha/beta fold hydrolase [Acetobacteraceae bacterium]